LDLRPICGRKAQAAHNILQLLDRLRERMQATDSQAIARQRWIELRPAPLGASGSLKTLLCGSKSGLDRRLDFVSPLACCCLFFPGNCAETLLHGLQAAFGRAEELNPCGFERSGVGSSAERRIRVRQEYVELGEKCIEVHGRRLSATS